MVLLLGWIIWGMAGTAGAQEFRTVTYTVKEGLSNNDVRSLTVDSSGFLWVGTSNGLNRFDGNSFQTFTHDPGDTGSIGGNLVQGFFIDRERRLWVGTNEGISLYREREQRFSNYSPDTSVLSNIGLSFEAFGEDGQGRLWVGTKNDLLVFHPVTGTWTSSGWARFADRVVSAQGNRLRVVVLDIRPKGPRELWVWTTFGLFSVETATRQFRYYPCPADQNKAFDYYGCHLRQVDGSGNPWISFFGLGIGTFDTTGKAWHFYRTPDSIAAWDNTAGLRKYSGDTLVYATQERLVFFDRSARRTVQHITLAEASSAAGFLCRDVLPVGHTCWIATNDGLVKLTPRPSLFQFHAVAGMKLLNRVYRSTAQGMMIYGSADGVRIQKDGMPVLNLSAPEKPFIAGQHLYWLELPALGKACFNGEDAFYVWDQRKALVHQPRWPPLRNPQNGLNIRNMVADRDGRVWIRTHDQGIYGYDPRKDSVYPVSGLPDGSRKMLSYLYYDSLANSLWIAEEFNGVFEYDIATRTVRHHLLNSPPSHRGAGVICISGDGRGRVWFNDVVSGIIEYDHRTDGFTRYTSHNGLLSDNVIWNCPDGRGGLWISTDLGLSCMDIATRRFTNYYSSAGYPATGDDGGFVSRGADGTMYMAHSGGAYSWQPAQFARMTPVGRLYLQQLQVSGRYLPREKEYRLAPKDNNIQLRLGWLSLEEDAPPAMEYRLNAGPWLPVALSGWLSFPGLPAGEYTLLVRARNDGREPLRLSLSIARPFWRQPWVLTVLALIAGAVLIGISRLRMAQLRKEARLRQQVMESEMATLRSQMNPHFVFNTLNSINSYIIENKTHQASDYLTDFSRLMRIILDHSRIKKVTLEEELKTVKLYLELESRRLEGSFDYRLDVEVGLDASSLQVPPLIIQPFAENAIWHGLRHKREGGHLDIDVRMKDAELYITVTDNGIGRQAAGRLQKGWRQASFGTAATIRRIRLADAGSEVRIEDLYGADGEAGGTRVTILLHLKTMHYAG